MEYFIIGSRWFKKIYPEFDRCKENADYDILIEKEEKYSKDYFSEQFKSNKIDIHIIPPLWNFLQKNSELDPNILFTLKASHVFWDNHWFEKTINDLYLLNKKNCKIIPDLFDELYLFWEKKFGKINYPNFSLSPDDFFKDAVKRKFSHDYLHECVKKDRIPAYKYAQLPNQKTVEIHEDLFRILKQPLKDRVVIEEAQVLGIERFILNGEKNQHRAYINGIKLLIKRLAPLWLAKSIIDNIHYYLTYRENFYYGKFN